MILIIVYLLHVYVLRGIFKAEIFPELSRALGGKCFSKHFEGKIFCKWQLISKIRENCPPQNNLLHCIWYITIIIKISKI